MEVTHHLLPTKIAQVIEERRGKGAVRSLLLPAGPP